jgi:hypothetical protein
MANEEAKLPTAGSSAFHEERTNFKINLLKNPNYFGTFPGLGSVVKKINYNTTYEQLDCLGLNPGTGFGAEGTLEAVIEIKLPNGYDSGPCGSGSTEWVRFYVEDGTTWTDLGATGVTVYNLAGSTFPVSYAVSVALPHLKKFCTQENVLNVRAILSWEFEPPANQPNFIPVWGNAVNARVQIAPALFWEVPIASLVGSELVKIDPVVESSLDLTKTLPAKTVQALSFAELKDIYAKSNVPSHRFGFLEATNIASASLEKGISAADAVKGLKTSSTNLTIGADLSAILGAIEDLEGDTTYEQLTCAGYNPQTRTLEAVVSIKLNAGYSGGLCTAGSYEYVSFFAFFGGVWNALGTAQVNVHDLNAITPGNPVNYAVIRLSNLTSEICEKLTAVPLRAILSWQTVPTGPDFIPIWGNVYNTHVQPQIGGGIEGENARLLRVGDVGVIGIQSSVNPALFGDYLANPTGVAEDCNNADDSPFGGTIGIEGAFTLNPAGTFNPVTGTVLSGAHPVIYQAFITPPSGPKFQLTNGFGIGVFPPSAPITNPEVVIGQNAAPPYGPVFGGVPGALYYTYYESADGQLVNPRVVAWFAAGGQPDGNYTIELDGFAWDGAQYLPMSPVSKTFYVYNGYGPGGNRPLPSLGLISAADCGNITVGDIITGDYGVADEFFGIVSVDLTPLTLGGTPIAMPTVYLSGANSGPDAVVYNGSNTTGTSGTFTIYTGNYDPNKDPLNNKQPNQTPLPPCGYTIQLIAWDRALVNTTCSGHENQEAVGFCLVAPPPTT